MPRSELHPNGFEHAEIALRIIHDNPTLTGKICRAAEVDMSDVVPLMTEAVRFLNLIAYQETQLTPAVKVDLAWHELILCTRYYESWCNELWHRFIHHNPGGDPAKNEANFATTLKLYRQYFGNVPVQYWGDQGAADCGACSGMEDK